MKINALLIALCLTASFAAQEEVGTEPEFKIEDVNVDDEALKTGDDSVPMPDMPDEAEMADSQFDAEDLMKQMDFIGNFACYLQVQKYLGGMEDKLKNLARNTNGQVVLQKLVGNLFKTCKENMSPDQQMDLLQVKDKEGEEQKPFEGFNDFDADKYLNESDPQLTEEDRKLMETYEGVEKEVNDMKKKYMKDQHGEEFNYEKGKMELFGFDLEKTGSMVVIAPIMGFFMFLLWFMWTKLFSDSNDKSKRKKKRKKDKRD